MMSDAPMLRPVRTVAPTSAPVSLVDAKLHLRVDHTDEDALISALIDAATSHLDGWSGVLGRCIMPQTWRQGFAAFPADGVLRLPFPDVSAVTVVYSDTDDAEQTLSSGDYRLMDDAQSSAIYRISGVSWPATFDRPDAVRVTMTCGFTEVPEALKAAIKLHLGTLYESREDAVIGASVTTLPLAHEALTAPFRRWSA